MNRPPAAGPIVWLGIILTTCLLLVLFQTMLWLVMPVLLAIIAYYLMSPLVQMAMARGMTRSRAVFIVTMFLSLFLILVGLDVGPKISEAVQGWRGKVGDYTQSGVKLVVNAQVSISKVLPFMHHAAAKPAEPVAPVTPKKRERIVPPPVVVGPPSPAAVAIDEQKENDAATEALKDKVATAAESYSTDIILELLHWIPSLLLVPYLTYFFLLDGPRFKRFLVQAIPNAFFEKTLYLFYRVDDQIRRYFQGLLSLTALDALCLGIGLWFIGFPAPFLLAILAAMMAWLPYLGSIAGCLMVVLVAAHHSPNDAWLPYEAVGLFVVVRLLDDFVFLPLTVGRSLSMHPLITVLMILLGGAVAGIAGLLLVMPVLGVVMVAGQIIGELANDERILARHRHARKLNRRRAQADLDVE